MKSRPASGVVRDVKTIAAYLRRLSGIARGQALHAELVRDRKSATAARRQAARLERWAALLETVRTRCVFGEVS